MKLEELHTILHQIIGEKARTGKMELTRPSIKDFASMKSSQLLSRVEKDLDDTLA